MRKAPPIVNAGRDQAGCGASAGAGPLFLPKWSRPTSATASRVGFGVVGLMVLLLLWLDVPCLEARPKWFKASESRKSARVAGEVVFRGSCDASAAVAIGTNLVMVASDEENRLRVYERDGGGMPVQTFDLTDWLGVARHSPETDLEGAARLGDRVYWIGSHSRNQEGRLRPNRCRFFATTFEVTENRVSMRFVGAPYQDLLIDLARAPQLKAFDLEKASQRAPKQSGGLNIEGLSATPDNQLLIAFRNPVPNGRALLLPFINPDEVVLRGHPAKFGEPILLDLEGLGVRDIAYAEGHYIIVAGSSDGQGHSRLFSWAGGRARPHVLKNVKLKGLNPEAIAIYPDQGLQEFQLFSDDSSSRQGKTECKDLRDGLARQFRGVWITHEPAED